MQADINATYTTLCKTQLTEVGRHFTCSKSKKATEKKCKFQYPYWKSVLSLSWKDMKQAESELNDMDLEI